MSKLYLCSSQKYLTYTYVGKLTTTGDKLSSEWLDREPGIIHIQEVVEHAKGMIICHIGGILFLQKQHYIHIISSAGQVTKNGVELLAPRALFRLAHHLQITDL